jgi:hypothetical protein
METWHDQAHEWNRERAQLAAATNTPEAAIAIGLFTIADRLADLTEVLAAADDADKPTTAPKAAESVLEEQYEGSS